jgi:hypothetical protein
MASLLPLRGGRKHTCKYNLPAGVKFGNGLFEEFRGYPDFHDLVVAPGITQECFPHLAIPVFPDEDRVQGGLDAVVTEQAVFVLRVFIVEWCNGSVCKGEQFIEPAAEMEARRLHGHVEFPGNHAELFAEVFRVDPLPQFMYFHALADLEAFFLTLGHAEHVFEIREPRAVEIGEKVRGRETPGRVRFCVRLRT